MSIDWPCNDGRVRIERSPHFVGSTGVRRVSACRLCGKMHAVRERGSDRPGALGSARGDASLGFLLLPIPRRPRVCACNHELLFSTYGPVVGRAFCAGTVVMLVQWNIWA